MLKRNNIIMKTKRIFYSIDVECTDKDIMNFVRLNHPGMKFNYEYVEDVRPITSNLDSLFERLGEILKPNK